MILNTPWQTLIQGQQNDEGVPIYTVEDIRAVDGYCPTNFDSMVPYSPETTQPNMVFSEQESKSCHFLKFYSYSATFL